MTRAGRRLAVLDAPSNLGLRPPEEGSVPGCYKAPGMFRDLGIVTRLGAHDAGVVTAPRYRAEWTPGQVRNEHAIADYSRRLADRLTPLLDACQFPVVLGGDCSILLGPALALSRRGRWALATFDGLDHRHPGNSDSVAAAGGEDLALLTGLGGELAELDGSRPYLRPEDAVVLGLRPEDEDAAEAAAAGIHLIDAAHVAADPAAAATKALAVLEAPALTGFWIHIDADVLDPEFMPAVDAPDPGGLTFEQLGTALKALLDSPRAIGLTIGIYDPDLDPDGRYGKRLADLLVDALA